MAQQYREGRISKNMNIIEQQTCNFGKLLNVTHPVRTSLISQGTATRLRKVASSLAEKTGSEPPVVIEFEAEFKARETQRSQSNVKKSQNDAAVWNQRTTILKSSIEWPFPFQPRCRAAITDGFSECFRDWEEAQKFKQNEEDKKIVQIDYNNGDIMKILEPNSQVDKFLGYNEGIYSNPNRDDFLAKQGFIPSKIRKKHAIILWYDLTQAYNHRIEKKGLFNIATSEHYKSYASLDFWYYSKSAIEYLTEQGVEFVLMAPGEKEDRTFLENMKQEVAKVKKAMKINLKVLYYPMRERIMNNNLHISHLDVTDESGLCVGNDKTKKPANRIVPTSNKFFNALRNKKQERFKKSGGDLAFLEPQNNCWSALCSPLGVNSRLGIIDLATVYDALITVDADCILLQPERVLSLLNSIAEGGEKVVDKVTGTISKKPRFFFTDGGVQPLGIPVMGLSKVTKLERNNVFKILRETEVSESCCMTNSKRDLTTRQINRGQNNKFTHKLI